MMMKRYWRITARRIFIITIAALIASSFLNSIKAQTQSAKQAELARLERIEELSESLANDMLDLSVAVRDHDSDGIAGFFAARLRAAPFPSVALAPQPRIKWIAARAWETGDARASAIRQMTRSAFLRGFSKFLDHFVEIEDVRFKVKESDFDEKETARARVAFYVIGRNAGDQREWARGAANITARQTADKRWKIDRFNLASLDSMIAASDIFSEVSLPAGVAASLPEFGSPQNSGFVWRGAAAADFNGDGWMDLFVTAPDRNYLYLNDTRARFRDASAEAGVKMLATGVAPLALDYDNDGDTDIFISNVGTQILLENRLVPDGRLEFRDLSLESGVSLQAIGFSAVAGDINGDGFADIYVASYNRYGQVTPDSWFRAANGTPNLLFVNQRNGTFSEEASKRGVDDRRWSYAAEILDIDGDGRLDVYVSNDFGENGLFINKGDRFIDEARERGALDPGNGMGVSFGDFNNDGRLDLHTTNMSSTAGNRILSRLFPGSNAGNNVLKKLAAGNNLFVNIGNGCFRDVTAEVGGFSAGWAWGGGFIDFDNDGWQDIFSPNGFISGKSMKDT